MKIDAKAEAEGLRNAMKGFGTDEKALTTIICRHNNVELQEIRKAFFDTFNRDLIEDIKSECGEAYEDALVGLLLTPPQCDAYFLNKAMKGAGTKEGVLVEHLCHRTEAELNQIEDAYLEMFQVTLKLDLEGDLGGHAEKLFVALITSKRTKSELSADEIAHICETLHSAGEDKFGTDEDTFIGVLTTKGPMALQAINLEYGRRFGDTLQKVVDKEMSGCVSDAMEAMLADHDTYYANVLWKAIDGMGTDEKALARILTSRRTQLKPINNVFMEKHGSSLEKMMEKELSGDLKKVLVAITSVI